MSPGRGGRACHGSDHRCLQRALGWRGREGAALGLAERCLAREQLPKIFEDIHAHDQIAQVLRSTILDHPELLLHRRAVPIHLAGIAPRVADEEPQPKMCAMGHDESDGAPTTLAVAAAVRLRVLEDSRDLCLVVKAVGPKPEKSLLAEDLEGRRIKVLALHDMHATVCKVCMATAILTEGPDSPLRPLPTLARGESRRQQRIDRLRHASRRN
mmetsp:Transcript_103291/g.202531  ORF Transcript_103291/g.202531 Transcript_103291/m.202531 type:complete len:213 (+) Transcript_103291:323-961(+)